jgi:hypothetical protein
VHACSCFLHPPRGTFYLFKTGPTWPNKVTENPSGAVLPIELITSNPELFKPECRYVLPGCPMADRFYQSWGRMWFHHKIVGTISNMADSWLGSLVLFFFFAEGVGLLCKLSGLDTTQGVSLVRLSDYFVVDDAVRFMTWGVFSAPIRTMYRHGPGFSTPMGELGFWGGKKLSDICATITSLEAPYWNEHVPDCHNIYHAKEEGFVSLMAAITIAFIAFVSYKCIMLYLKSLD